MNTILSTRVIRLNGRRLFRAFYFSCNAWWAVYVEQIFLGFSSLPLTYHQFLYHEQCLRNWFRFSITFLFLSIEIEHRFKRERKKNSYTKKFVFCLFIFLFYSFLYRELNHLKCIVVQLCVFVCVGAPQEKKKPKRNYQNK